MSIACVIYVKDKPDLRFDGELDIDRKRVDSQYGREGIEPILHWQWSGKIYLPQYPFPPLTNYGAHKIKLVFDLDVLGVWEVICFIGNITILTNALALRRVDGDSEVEMDFTVEGMPIRVNDEAVRAVREIVVAKKHNRLIDFKGIRVPEWIQDILEQELSSDSNSQH